MKIRCIAIDDEPLALDIIKDYCQRIPFLDLVETFDNAIDSINYIKSNQIDLLFLDIQMEDLSGIQLLKVLNPHPLVIFTTAYDIYALQGFELDAVDYLLKPISFERFLKAAGKVNEIMSLKQLKTSEKPNPTGVLEANLEYFFVKTEFRLEKILFNEILYIEGMGDYLRIIMKTKKIMTLQSFKKMEEILPVNNFLRVHKSYIVAIDKIENIERCRIKIGDKFIPISNTYKKTFFDFLGNEGIT